MSTYSKQREGFSTIELLFAFALATLFLSGAALIAFGSQTIGLDVSLTQAAIGRVSTQMGKALASTSVQWHAVLPAQSGFYTEQNSASSVTPCLKEMESSSSWQSERGRGQNIALQSYLGSVHEANAQGGGCDPFVPVDVWDNPNVLGSVSISNASGTGIAVRSVNNHVYTFLTANSAILSDDDFIVVDSTDAEDPSVVGTPLSNLVGLNGVAVGGSYAYVLNNENVGQLRVIDVSNPLAPQEEVSAMRTLPNIVSSCNPVGACLSGRSIAYFDGRLYIGTSYIAFGTSVQNHELHVYCVGDGVTPGCTPKNPVWLGSYNVNRNVNDIAVRTELVGGVVKTLVYLALSGSTNALAELKIYDASLPSGMYEVGSFNPSGTLYGTSIALLGNRAYLGRERAAASSKDFYVLDISDPTHPTELYSRKLGIANSTAVVGIAVQGSFAFVATSDSTNPLFVFDVSDATNPTMVGTCGLNSDKVIHDVVYHDNRIYSVNKNADVLTIIYDQPSSCI
ncbi:MAG: hypothetical protein RLZZ76_752 [Candidatus Parcubacteria bacterium]|jgi:hypothetical protein